jgi:hypothetical protein
MRTPIAVALLATVLALPADAGLRKQCRLACGHAVGSCIVQTGKSRRFCLRQVIGRCRHEGLESCGRTAPVDFPCHEGNAPACGGTCPSREFACVPNPAGGCNCEAPACGPVGDGTCGGVCEDGARRCVARGNDCVCQ